MKDTLPYYELSQLIDGELYTDNIHRVAYSTDASSYRELPQAVVLPRHKEDIRMVLDFARSHHTSVIPRGAGTSLAGQVVGPGIVVDVSRYMDQILEFNKNERWITVQPGVNISELNIYLKPYGLQFGPETSTANRCRLGGMLGNNSCGLRSLTYGSVREHVLEVETILADGSEVVFGPLSKAGFEAKCSLDPLNLETQIYRQIRDVLSDTIIRDKVTEVYPEPAVARRNMGYAVDILMDTDPFTYNGVFFNFSKLLAGSEGTLAFTTAIKLNLVPLPPPIVCVVPAHFSSLEDALNANIIVLRHRPSTIELMDDIIMDCTKGSLSQRENRFFIQGDPKAILMIEFTADTKEDIETVHAEMVKELTLAGYGYHFPLVFGDEQVKKIWGLRTAGLGLLSNIPGDKRSTTVIEDTAVAPEKLPDYIAGIKIVMAKYGLECVYYAHIATGELHLRPLLNLKDLSDQKIFADLAQDVAALVKKFRGSLSGEHGDGRLRGSFIPFMFGEEIYAIFKAIKKTWDPWNVLNPNKITDVPPIGQDLRYGLSDHYPDVPTTFDFSYTHGYLRAIEQCNGSGDCRKSEIIGGTMCPTYMATREEDKTTRARANMLREYMNRPENDNSLFQKDVYSILDLCLSCKGCKGECPSNVDMAKIKAEFLQQYYDENGIPFRSWLIAYLPRFGKLAMAMRPLTNYFMAQPWFKRAIGFHPDRKITGYSSQSLRNWGAKHKGKVGLKGKVYLFADEFTNYQETEIGIKAILLLERLGYEVVIPKHRESSRTYLSKGLVREAKKIAIANVLMLKDIITEKTPMVGIEPSTILTFRDEYPELVDAPMRGTAIELGKNALMFDEFFVREMEKGIITASQFTDKKLEIKLHAHCQQKAVASSLSTRRMLALPENFTVQELKTGCCGMAGSFGYEKGHYELSMQIGELALFPEVRKCAAPVVIAAPGTSCRHHIKDGTGKTAVHPIEVMYGALIGSAKKL